jgi:hypothetical protein
MQNFAVCQGKPPFAAISGELPFAAISPLLFSDNFIKKYRQAEQFFCQLSDIHAAEHFLFFF